MQEGYQLLSQTLHPNDFVVAAISGGPDSMALLDLLIKVRRKLNINIVCAHVNHKIRVESDLEEEFVKEYCLKNNVIFEVTHFDEYKTEKFSEASAREKRYAYFDTMIQKYHASYLVTAHHGDDLMESILMRIARGSTLSGYAGIRSISKRGHYFILRPLLHETKASILEYTKVNQIDYVIDASNEDERYTRNRYRKNILPILKSENAMIHEKYLKYSETLLEAEDYILSETEKVLDHVLCHNKIDICVLNQYYPYLKKRVLMKYLEGIYQENLSKLTDIHLSHLLCLMESEKYNDLYFLPLFKVAKKRGNIFVIEDIELLNGYSYEFTGVIQLPNGKVIEQVESENNTNYYCRLNKSDVHFPLFIRTRKNGDRMTIKNMNGTKKINDIFTDLKIPSEQRDVWPILVDSLDNILWLPGLKKSSFDIEKENNCDIILKYH